jgi:hypothetical protein
MERSARRRTVTCTRARRSKTADSVREFAEQLPGLKDNQAIGLGSLAPEHPDKVPVTTTKREARGVNGVTRTKENFTFRERPTFILKDFDAGGMPDETQVRIDALGGVWDTCCHILPGLTGAAHIIRRSTSAGVFHKDTGQPIPGGSKGLHCYVGAQNGADSRRYLYAAHARAWIKGYGWGLIGKAGQFLERSVFDRYVGSPERLVFEASAILVDPVRQDPEQRKPIVVDGDPVIDTLAVCPPLTVKEEHDYKQAVAKEKQRLRPTMQETRAKYIKEETAAIMAQSPGMSQKEAERNAELKTSGVLLPSQFLISNDGSMISVAAVLADPKVYVDLKIADPIEGPGYGASTAQIKLHYDGRPWIFSFAHGETHYEIKHDHRTVQAAIDAAKDAEKLEALLHAGVWSVLSQFEIDDICGKLAKILRVTRTSIRKTLEQAQKAKWREIAEFKRERNEAERTDPRPVVDAPNPAGEYLPVMKQLNDVLGAVGGDEPPMRDTCEGYLQAKRLRVSSSMHALTAAGANNEESEEDRLPAPPHVQLVVLGQEEVAELIERHICYVSPKGNLVHLDDVFVKHFMRRKDGVLPEVLKVVTMPIVLQNGEIMGASRGIDRERRVIYHIDPALIDGLPSNVSDAAVADSMRYLFDVWLCDVATTHEGKCILLALALSELERHLLGERPVFFITAGRRGSGKTTTIQMIQIAVTGRKAACATWSVLQEERRKRIFSALLENPESILFDNIPRGHTIGDKDLEMICTAETMTDRVLGVSRDAEVSCAAILVFTGNNIGPRGDLASRALCVELTADRVDPENREFEHNDPVAWTEANRLPILRAMYTILLGNPKLKEPRDTPSETRFKTWHRLVGSAIEHASKLVVGEANAVEFSRVFIAQEEESDEETGGLVDLLRMIANWHFRPGKPAGGRGSQSDQCWAVFTQRGDTVSAGIPIPRKEHQQG